MKHEKIIKRPDGSSVKINLSLWIDFRDTVYNIDLSYLPAGKRKWLSVGDDGDYSWRKLNHTERKEYRMNEYLQHVSAEEILQAKIELWEKLKPV